MGGAVSSGRDNNELIDNLMGGNYIRTAAVERVFRALDRAEYMTPEFRENAYNDQAWRNGPLHLSAPCIYSEVLECLELKPGHSFLNIGSGTGYFSTMVGLIIGSSGISHGVEVHPYVVEYAIKKLIQFIENSATLDEFDFCQPKYYCGNGLCLAPLQAPYDRVYVGAACPKEYKNYFKQLVKVGGILVMPYNDNLVQIRRTGENHWVSRNLLNVSFATLKVPTKQESAESLKLDEQCPPRLQVLSRAVVRAAMRESLYARHPQLRQPPPARPSPRSCPRRICIPIDDDSDLDGLNALHDLDRATGANEMNALLSLVLSMGQNRVAGAIRYPSYSVESSPNTSESEEEERDNDGEDGDGPPDGNDPPPIYRELPFRPSLSQFGLQFERGLRNNRNNNAANGPSPGPSESPPDQRGGADGVPAEVEIFLGKQMAGTSSSNAHWEGVETKMESSSEDETTETSNEQKRPKLDSGIGEGESSSGSSPVKNEPKSDESEGDVLRSTSSENLTDDLDEENIGGRRRRQKRGHCQLGPQSSSSTECEDSTGSAEGGAGRRRKRRAALFTERERRSDARLVRLSIMMKRGVKELPLPHALKKYVNLGRCFEF